MVTTAAEIFPHLPDSARLWAFGVARPLSPEEAAALLEAVDAFLDEWRAHGHPLAAAREWAYGRFLLVGVDDRVTPPSGCSIDALVHVLQDLEKELDTEIVGGAPVWYREGGPEGEIHRVSRPRFMEEAVEGRVSEDTIVFDLSLTRVGELRQGRWEVPAGESWHRRYLS